MRGEHFDSDRFWGGTGDGTAVPTAVMERPYEIVRYTDGSEYRYCKVGLVLETGPHTYGFYAHDGDTAQLVLDSLNFVQYLCAHQVGFRPAPDDGEPGSTVER